MIISYVQFVTVDPMGDDTDGYHIIASGTGDGMVRTLIYHGESSVPQVFSSRDSVIRFLSMCGTAEPYHAMDLNYSGNWRTIRARSA